MLNCLLNGLLPFLLITVLRSLYSVAKKFIAQIQAQFYEVHYNYSDLGEKKEKKPDKISH